MLSHFAAMLPITVTGFEMPRVHDVVPLLVAEQDTILFLSSSSSKVSVSVTWMCRRHNVVLVDPAVAQSLRRFSFKRLYDEKSQLASECALSLGTSMACVL